MYLDIFTSPISRIILMVHMILMICARLSSFLLFSFYWSPGKFYPLLIFVLIHMIISAVLHIVFSEDIIYWRLGKYGKFFHNVVMNSFACIYFHNYLRKEEEDIQEWKEHLIKEQNPNRRNLETWKPRTHISTYLRQVMFEVLYVLEFIVLLSVGFCASADGNMVHIRNTIIMYCVALFLKFCYYGLIHIWSDPIIKGKSSDAVQAIQKTANKDFTTQLSKMESEDFIDQVFGKYSLSLQNFWILGNLRTTKVPIPKKLTNWCIRAWRKLEQKTNTMMKNVKNIDVLFNFIFFVFGIGLIVIGISILVDLHYYALSFNFEHLFTKLLVFSIALIVNGVFFSIVRMNSDTNNDSVHRYKIIQTAFNFYPSKSYVLYIFWALFLLSLATMLGALLTIFAFNYSRVSLSTI